MGGASGFSAGAGSKALAAAHERLLADPTLQFDFTPIPKLPRINLPPWMEAIGRWIAGVAKAIGPYAINIFWIGLALAAVAVVFLIARELSGARWPGLRRRASIRPSPADWRPEAFRARALLEDADRLAAAGRFDEAAHLLLLRGVDEIEDRRPRLVKPALTARDIAALAEVPPAARGAFSTIAAVVETSLFGGARLDGEAWRRCREAYQAFAFPRAWA
ncbi:MAG TPA: DUF4129 domain-containing protein [Caulobacteraceae bacterium]